ncbi:MAG: Thioredoxin-M [Verrucomicrobiota bacterium]|jgi:thioredoxin 2
MNTIQIDARGLIVACPNCGQRNRLPYQRLAERPRCPKCRAELSAPGVPIDIEDDVAFGELTARSTLPVLIDFWVPWCGPCKMVAPEVAKIAAEGAGRWLVAKVNTEELPVLAQRFRVSSIPLFMLFQSGAEVARQPGALPAAALRQFIQQRSG